MPNPFKIWDFSLCKIPAVKRMLICAGVVQLTILMQQPIMPLYVAELQGSMERIVLISGIVFSVTGISGVLASPGWGILGQNWAIDPYFICLCSAPDCSGLCRCFRTRLSGLRFGAFVGGLAFAGIFPAL